MDPVSLAIISALSAGAASGLTDTTKKAIVDGYEGLKALLKKKFGSNSEVADAIEKLQAKPNSSGRSQTLEEELKAVNADKELQLRSAADSLLQLIKALPQGAQHIQIAQGMGIAQADRGSTATVSIGSPSRKNDD